MHLEFLVEELSCEAALNGLLPKLFGTRASWAVHPHRGKDDLLGNLSARLRSYASWLPSDWRVVVLVDEDRQDCLDLKKRLEAAAAQAKLITPRTARGHSDRIQVVNRIAVEELEAWFFGDPEALRAAFPGVSATLERATKYRDPDSIAGGTWEQLERVLQKAGYYPQGLAKIELARKVSEYMEPHRNRSQSFSRLIQALETLVPG